MKKAAAQQRKPSPFEAIKAAKKKAMKRMGAGDGDMIVKDPFQNSLDAKHVKRGETGVLYDGDMLKHENPWDGDHIECPDRLRRTRQRLEELDLLSKCTEIASRCATDDEIMLAHSQEHLDNLKKLVSNENLEEVKREAQPKSVYVNGESLHAARLAAGAAIDLATAVVRGSVQNGLALVRPPGHHASKNSVNGFCLCNNVAIAARHALNNLGVKRILIVDFDVHHGQGVQREFLNEPAVLYASIHRYEHGKYCPHLRESDYDVIGEDPAQGTNVNIPLNESGLGDPDYLAIFHQIILPLAYEYNPELVLVSAGFDAAFGDPEGEMKVSPIMYGHMVSSLMTLAGGKVALVLEGGYFIETLAEGCAMALRALLGLDSIRLGQLAGPSCSVVDSILNSISALRPHWNNLQMQEEYSISEYDAAVDKNCHVPLLSYEGQSYLEKRDLDKTELDLNNFYWKNTDDSVAQFTATFRSMQVRYLDQLKVSKREIGLVYDRRMARHSNMEEPNHPERPERILEMIKRHEEYGLLERTVKIESRSASREEVLLVHDPVYFDNMASLPEMSQKELDECSNGFDSVYFNPSSFECALLSCGSLLNVVDSVCEGNTQSGVAIIRPPGHHAEEDDACGFCIFNNVAVAAKHAIEMHGLKRVLILDWDVHHGNGIQNMFYDDPQVLYISVHRYDNGTFFPNRLDANYDFVGEGRGEGFNVNIPWNGSGMGDPEYTCALFNVILPIAYQFDPDLVLVSAGFDAARGDPLGFCKVSPEMYGHIVHQLRNLAGGKVIVALEGGYNLNTISLCMAMCTKALLGDPMPPISPAPPLASAVETIRRVSSAHSRFWSSLRFAKKLPGSFQDLKAQMGSIVKKKDSKLLFTVKKEDIDADDRKDDSKDNTDAADPVSSMAQRLGNVSLIDTKEEVDENVAIKSKHNETV